MITAQSLSRSARVRHAFFTREGGVSEGVFASLNCGFGSGDDPARVAVNRARAMAGLDLEGDDLTTLYQVHSAVAVVVDTPWPADNAPKADAAVTRRPGVALGVLTADCAPVLMADAEAGVIGAAHAGWRGALAGVAEALVETMTAEGAAPGRITAAIGPCIRQPSYEVGAELRQAFIDTDEDNAGFFADGDRDGHFLFDLPGYLTRRLQARGIAVVETVAGDTCADAGRFFSYRRATHRRETDYGRALAAVALTG